MRYSSSCVLVRVCLLTCLSNNCIQIILQMGGGDRCSIGCCNNDRCYPNKLILHSHVNNLQFHGLPKDPQLQKVWHDKVRQGRSYYTPSIYTGIKICSNHFEDGERTFRCPIPTICLTESDLKTHPAKRPLKCREPTPTSSASKKKKNSQDVKLVEPAHFTLGFASTQITREDDVRFLKAYLIQMCSKIYLII